MRKPVLRIGPYSTQTRLYSNRRLLDAYNFRFRKKRICTIFISKNNDAHYLRLTCAADLCHCKQAITLRPALNKGLTYLIQRQKDQDFM